MSSEPIFLMNTPILQNADMSASQTSAVVDMAEVIGYAAHSIWTGTPVGDVVLEVSNDGINFVPIDTQATAGIAGQHVVNIERMHIRYARCRYERTSGTGSITIYLSAKDL